MGSIMCFKWCRKWRGCYNAFNPIYLHDGQAKNPIYHFRLYNAFNLYLVSSSPQGNWAKLNDVPSLWLILPRKSPAAKNRACLRSTEAGAIFCLARLSCLARVFMLIWPDFRWTGGSIMRSWALNTLWPCIYTYIFHWGAYIDNPTIYQWYNVFSTRCDTFINGCMGP